MLQVWWEWGSLLCLCVSFFLSFLRVTFLVAPWKDRTGLSSYKRSTFLLQCLCIVVLQCLDYCLWGLFFLCCAYICLFPLLRAVPVSAVVRLTFVYLDVFVCVGVSVRVCNIAANRSVFQWSRFCSSFEFNFCFRNECCPTDSHRSRAQCAPQSADSRRSWRGWPG